MKNRKKIIGGSILALILGGVLMVKPYKPSKDIVHDVPLKEMFCHNGYNSVSLITDAGGGVVGCELKKCDGSGADYYETSGDPGVACGSSDLNVEVSCVIDTCMGSATSPFSTTYYDKTGTSGVPGK
jgi:hypothetical protein